jgi:hypothetical protein
MIGIAEKLRSTQRVQQYDSAGRLIEFEGTPTPRELEAAARIEKLEAALTLIAECEVPRTACTTYRGDGKSSKDDQCRHNRRMREGCEECTAEFAQHALESWQLRSRALSDGYADLSPDELLTECRRLRALVDGRFKDARLLRAGPDGKGCFVLDIQSGLSGVMAENMIRILEGEGAPNYVEVEAGHPDIGPLTFTIAKRWGRSSAAQLAEAKAALLPFAALADQVAREAITSPTDATVGLLSVNYGDLRRASQLLNR